MLELALNMYNMLLNEIYAILMKLPPMINSCSLIIFLLPGLFHNLYTYMQKTAYTHAENDRFLFLEYKNVLDYVARDISIE